MDQQPDSYRLDLPDAAGSRRPRTGFALGAASLAASVAVAYSSGHPQVVAGSGTAVQAAPAMDRQGPGGVQSPGAPAGSATAAQQVGVVDIDTVLGYQRAAAAGTGMVISSSGEILTNNHVIAGATSISVRVVTTGKAYRAAVVGTDATHDVAVLQLQNASGLQTAAVGDSTAVQVGDHVTGVGNAGGTGGTPGAATGTIVALDQALTATDENGQNPERLTGMIETDAPIEAGDSGGPLYDSANHVIGMDTAASAQRRGTAVGFAIPINRATALAAQIEAGEASATIHLGYPGFLGLSATSSGSTSGALVESVLAGGPAAQAGIGAGDVITAVGNTPVTSSAALRTAVAGHRPGQRVTVTWLDTAGHTRQATIALAAGPAD